MELMWRWGRWSLGFTKVPKDVLFGRIYRWYLDVGPLHIRKKR